ncbi:Sensors of blue-light using FAD [Maribacter sedimenticola]|uniref:Sensors of blue-light using FAD n=1 Tax=Maribacter sedimenticola TaxID=228956 RepID=A0ABY1SL95_9FLAO|nr:BLUF domain-containing protein [Maribacter sedimenticola]SNR74602.1 Sensors of blue-light using FAD [Maribacter sedimenticola]
MHELTYRSTAKSNLTKDDLENILTTSVANNKNLNITGCLIYHKGMFVQTLQGAKNHIFNVYNNIESDMRHDEVNLLWEGSATKAVFDGWHMAYYSPDEKTDEVELKVFENNLLILSSYHNNDSASVRLFWKQIKSLIFEH